MNQNEIQAILAQLEPEARLMVMLAVSAGLRRSEFFGLQWGDVMFHEMQISIQPSIYLGTTNSPEEWVFASSRSPKQSSFLARYGAGKVIGLGC